MISFHQNRVEGLALAIKNNDWFPKINYFFLGGYGYASSLFYPDAYLYLPALLRVLGLSFVASMAIFVFAVNLATFSLTYYAGRLMALSKKEAISLPFCMAYLSTACKTCLIAKR